MTLDRAEQLKREVAYHAVDTFVRRDTRIGLGSGTTAYWAIDRVGELVASGWQLSAVPTSKRTAELCRARAIPLAELSGEPLDVDIDGADEVGPDFTLIKGGGGALFREKAVALVARAFVVIVTQEKLVKRLGAFPLPVEVVPFAMPYVKSRVEALGAQVHERAKRGIPYRTDNGNVILDCAFDAIDAPRQLDAELRAIHGVVATGIFLDLARYVLVGTDTGVETIDVRGSNARS